CQDDRAYFSDLLDSHIGLTERVPLEAHLRECEACRGELEARRLSQRARPGTTAWRPELKLDAFGKTLDHLRPADLLHRLRQRILPRAPVIPRGRPRPIPSGTTLERRRVPAESSPRRSVHERERSPWRSRPAVAWARSALGAVRSIEVAAPLRRAGSALRLMLGSLAAALADIGGWLEAVGMSGRHGGAKAFQVARTKTLGAARAGIGVGGTMARIAGRGLEDARRMLLTAAALGVCVWDHRRIFSVSPRQLRLAVMVLAVSLGAIGLVRYRSELDLAVRHWVPSAPSSEVTPPTRMASTEPATRPEIPPVTPPVTVV